MNIKKVVVAAKVLVVVVVGFAGLAYATPTISDLKVTTIEPVGLAIDYTVSGATKIDDGRQLEISLVVTNSAQTISGETNCVNGAHRVYWNTAKDGISVENAKTTISARYSDVCKVSLCLYCVIDLSGGTNTTVFPVTYLSKPPDGGFNTDEYKTTKLVLRLCPAGVDPLGRYTLTRDFYVGLFEVTQKQWELVMGDAGEYDYSYGKGDTYPVYFVRYARIRCPPSSDLGWPVSSAVNSYCFMGVLRKKTGLSEFDLPTEAQWEYACRAGTKTEFNTGDGETALAEAGWYPGNANRSSHPVGGKLPNAWGLYDMHGNIYEWCLDWHKGALTGNDPVGATSGSRRHVRGGCWCLDVDYANSSYRYYGGQPEFADEEFGFRLFRTVP